MPILEFLFAAGEELIKLAGVRLIGHRGTLLRWLSILWFPVVEFIVYWNDAFELIAQSTELESGALLAATAYMNAGGRLLHITTCIAFLKASKIWLMLFVCIVCHWLFNLAINHLFTQKTFANELGLFGILSLPLLTAIIFSLPIVGLLIFEARKRN